MEEKIKCPNCKSEQISGEIENGCACDNCGYEWDKYYDNVKRFISDMKKQYNMNFGNILKALQDDSQHDFIMQTQKVTIEEATKIIEATEKYLMNRFFDSLTVRLVRK